MLTCTTCTTCGSALEQGEVCGPCAEEQWREEQAQRAEEEALRALAWQIEQEGIAAHKRWMRQQAKARRARR